MKGDRRIYLWLITGCVLVSLMVIVGGITRLTQSGLSMVEWKPIMGTLPPLNESEWMDAFDKYKQSPEFFHFNSDFQLADFKSIFWWEYIHRLLARVIGLVFIIPFAIFWIRKKLSPSLKKKLFIIFALGAFQGVLGWLMVKSGLVDVPHVSHYRLAAHLLTALALLCYIYWVALWVKNDEPVKVNTNNRFLNLAQFFFGLILIQITYGAFVAGLKAGFQYNTFPLMGDSFVPDIIGVSMKDYGFMGVFDSPPVVQFIHRILAISIVIITPLLWLKSRKFALNDTTRKAIVYVLIAVGIQFTLGILTILYAVPVSLGVIHQFGAIITLLATVYLIFTLRKAINPAEA